jgi:hypothetical protein
MEALKHPVLGLSNVSLATQYLHVRDTFGVLPADYLERFFAELNRPQQDVPFLSVIHRIALYANMCVTAHAPLHDLNKIQLLKTAFGFAPYDDAITRYTREHPHIPRAAGQAAVPEDQSYASLLAVLTRESQLLQVTVLPPQHSLEAFRHGASALAATTGQPIKPARPPAAPAAPAHNPARTDKYCWGHGHCGHPAVACKAPLPGHQTTATATNRMGGATYTWTELTDKKRQQAKKDGPAGITA